MYSASLTLACVSKGRCFWIASLLPKRSSWTPWSQNKTEGHSCYLPSIKAWGNKINLLERGYSPGRYCLRQHSHLMTGMKWSSRLKELKLDGSEGTWVAICIRAGSQSNWKRIYGIGAILGAWVDDKLLHKRQWVDKQPWNYLGSVGLWLTAQKYGLGNL